MRRVAVIGCGGSGKTTLANELAARRALPVVHIDSHYWRTADGTRVESTPEQWRKHHRELIAADAWVIDGMKLGVLDERLARADTVIYLDLPTRECLSGILRRRLRYRGRLRPDLGVYDRISCEFLRWVWSFRRRHRPALLAMLDGFDGERIVLRRRRDVRNFLSTVPKPTATVAFATNPADDLAAASSPEQLPARGFRFVRWPTQSDSGAAASQVRSSDHGQHTRRGGLSRGDAHDARQRPGEVEGADVGARFRSARRVRRAGGLRRRSLSS
jgi:adenylate kinase family enzyme